MSIERKPLAAAAFALGAAIAGPVAAQEQQAAAPTLPLWELRLGASALYAPDYPGADQSHVNFVGAPIFIYRGDRIRIGSEDDPTSIARAVAVEQPLFELDLSVDAAFGADSDENDARAGMPDLETQLEIGPQLTVNIHDTGWTDEGRRRLRFLLPVRFVAATDFSDIEELGYVIQPTLTYRRQWPGSPRTSFSTTFAAVWASEGVQDYYYEVDPAFATLSRPAYDAQEGYLGTHMQISGRREIRPNIHAFLTYRLRNMSGAANDDSPLHLADTTHALSVSVVWTAFSSSRPARNGDR